jgi:hypothetical protein
VISKVFLNFRNFGNFEPPQTRGTRISETTVRRPHYDVLLSHVAMLPLGSNMSSQLTYNASLELHSQCDRTTGVSRFLHSQNNRATAQLTSESSPHSWSVSTLLTFNCSVAANLSRKPSTKVQYAHTVAVTYSAAVAPQNGQNETTSAQRNSSG